VLVVLFILVLGIERFIVLVVVEGMVERQNTEDDLRRQLQEAVAHVRHLQSRLAVFSTEEDIIPINSHTAG
jgi:hypothetical protein